MNVNDPLPQMTFRALNRVKNLGQKTVEKVFDQGMIEWYEQFLKECDPEQKKEIEYHDINRSSEFKSKCTVPSGGSVESVLEESETIRASVLTVWPRARLIRRDPSG